MQVEGSDCAWERDLSLKYLLVSEDEDGEERLLARIAEVEGLFADPAPVERQRLTLVGCVLDGPLPEELCVKIWDGDRPTGYRTLLDVRVVEQRVRDVVVEAGVEPPQATYDCPEPPADPRFELLGEGPDAVGSCERIDGLLIPHPLGPDVPMELIGCEPTERLSAVLREPELSGYTELWAVDRTGRLMAFRAFALDITASRPSTLGEGLIDITIADGPYDPPPLLARPLWEAWYEGIPDTLNSWAPYSLQGRHEWLLLAMGNQGPQRATDRSGGTHHLDGRFVTDGSGLHCALGEALLGPGGYYGWGGDGFDCLHGGFGVVPPFTLVWHDADVARQAPGLRAYFEETVRELERRRVTVVLR